MRGLHDLCRSYLADRADCAAYLPVFGGEASDLAATSALKRADTNGLEAAIDDMPSRASAATHTIVEAIAAHRAALDWWSTYTEADMAGRGMAAGMAACQFCGPGAPFDAPDGRAGFFYVKEDVEYAPHRHEPAEIYAVLAGRARFWNEAEGWRQAEAGDVIHTSSWSWHAMSTDRGPVLIMWAWIGAGYDAYPVFRDQTGLLPE